MPEQPADLDLDAIETNALVSYGLGWHTAQALIDECRRLRAKLAATTQERDAIATVFDAYTGDCDALQEEARRLRALVRGWWEHETGVGGLLWSEIAVEVKALGLDRALGEEG